MERQYHEAIYEYVFGNVPELPFSEQHRKGIDFALTSLDELTFGIMMYRFKDGMTSKEIAALEGISTSNVSQRIRNAAANMRKPLLRRFMERGFEGMESPEFGDWEAQLRIKRFLDLGMKSDSLGQLGLPSGLTERLNRHGIKSIKELKEATDEALLKIRNIGPSSLAEIKEALNKYDNAMYTSPEMRQLTLQFIDDLLIEKEKQLAMIERDILALNAIRATIRVPAHEEKV